jgi:SH3 domain protein
MKKTIPTVTIFSFIAIATLAGVSSLTLAEDRYVSDIVYIPLRADKDNQAGVLKNSLASGTKLKFIREEEDASKNKWSQVITPDGVEGWVRSQNLINEPTAALKLEAFTSGSSNVLELQKQNFALKNELESLKTTYQTLLKDTEEMRSAAASDINMEQENQKMHRENQLLQTERDVLKAENYQLKNTDRYNQRLYGGALVVCGVVLSLILQLFGKRKRHSDWN